jgi:[NiFe] hydrogenase diaphorase moiety small subunit
MSDQTVTMIVDGEPVPAKEGQSILEACDDAGVYIPRLCYHPDLPPGGHCRVCTVKVNGRPANACTHPVGDGIVIECETDELNEFRRRIIEFLFVEGNHFCPSCEASGSCELQALAYRLGMVRTTMAYLWPKREVDASHPDVYIDRDRCVVCGRCVRASRHADGKQVFGFEGRGIDKRIAVDAAHGLGETNMTQSDRAAAICPTGSLVVKRQGFLTPVGERKYDHQPIGSEIEKK